MSFDMDAVVRDRGETITRWIAGEVMQTYDQNRTGNPWKDYPAFDGSNVPNLPSIRIRIKPGVYSVWINAYRKNPGDDAPGVSVHFTRELADLVISEGASWHGRQRIARVRVEYQEGQFDEQ